MMGVAGFAVALMVTSLLIATCADGKEFFHHREIKVQRFLKQLNKPALKSIKVSYTNFICIYSMR